MPERIWTNNRFDPPLDEKFAAAVAPRTIVYSSDAVNNYLSPANRDAALAANCQIAFGQPRVEDLLASTTLRFVQLTTAGYTRYDRDDLRAFCTSRGVPVCNASAVYAEPCAQHALAFMLAAARRLADAFDEQAKVSEKRVAAWSALSIRRGSVLLTRGANVIIVGYGAIARRLVELLAPFGVTIRAFRRAPRGDENCPTSPIDAIEAYLPTADHVVNILPLNEQTRGFFDADRFGQMKRGTTFYNIGRGDTVDQPALIRALVSGQVAQAFLDVTSPEPLPADHPLWTAPNCHITPHTAGGWDDETPAQVAHFLANLKRFDAGEPLKDRIV